MEKAYNKNIKMKKPRIALLTTFGDFNPSFSLCSVVRQQLVSLVKHGYKPVLIVLDRFNDDKAVPQGVEIRKILPAIILEPYSAHNLDNLDKDVALVKEAMEKHMADIDVVLAHDIIFINSYLPYNVAMRKAIDGKLSKLKWLHWMHSGPSYAKLDGSVWDNLYTLPKNSRLIYMNYTDAIRAAEHYHTLPKSVRTIFNPMDIRELYGFHPLTRELIDDYDLMKPTFICTYPLSTTRMGRIGKQLTKVIWIMAELKKRGHKVALVVPNAHANADKEKKAIEKMYEFAHSKGLEKRELIFTSFHKPPKWELGVPHKVIVDLFTLGNLFIFPSVSENCPLILLEAMAGKNLLVLNQSFQAMKDFAGNNAMYFRFGSLLDDPQYPDGLDKYMADVVLLIESEMKQNKSLLAQTNLRQMFNVDWIFLHQLEPAIMELLHGE